MKVICTRPSKRLIKGLIYQVVALNNLNTRGYQYFRPTIKVYVNDSIQIFHIDNFKPIDTEQFPQINWICPEYTMILNERDQTKIDKNLKSGDYVVPIYDNLKTLIKGRKYLVKDVNFHDHKSSSGQTTWTDILIKLDGSNRFYKGYNFRKCTSQESREIGLSQLFDEDVNTEKVNKFKRKFDYFDTNQKKKILLEFIAESTNDRFRHQVDIIDWAILKSASKYKIIRSDFDLVNNLTLIEIMDILK